METLRTGTRIVSVVLFAIMFLSVLAQVFFRYVLEMSAGWAVEVALNSFLFGAWWTIIWQVALKDHVRFDVIYALLPSRVQLPLRIASGIVVAVLLLAAVPAAIKYVSVMNRITTGVLKMPLSWVYAIFVLFLVMMALRLLLDLFKAFRELVPKRSARA